MIIDAHVHVGASLFFQIDADEAFLVRQADEAGFDKLFITELNALFYDMSEGNDALAKRVARHPGRLIGYCQFPDRQWHARMGRGRTGARENPLWYRYAATRSAHTTGKSTGR